VSRIATAEPGNLPSLVDDAARIRRYDTTTAPRMSLVG
jgi:hypothetical protein